MGPLSCMTREATSTRPEGTASRAGGLRAYPASTVATGVSTPAIGTSG